MRRGPNPKYLLDVAGPDLWPETLDTRERDVEMIPPVDDFYVAKCHSDSEKDIGEEVEEVEVPPSGGARGSADIAPPWRAVREEVFEEEALEEAPGVAAVVARSPEPFVATSPEASAAEASSPRGPRPPQPPPRDEEFAGRSGPRYVPSFRFNPVAVVSFSRYYSVRLPIPGGRAQFCDIRFQGLSIGPMADGWLASGFSVGGGFRGAGVAPCPRGPRGPRRGPGEVAVVASRRLGQAPSP